MFIILDIVYLLALPFLLFYLLFTWLKGHPARKGLVGRLGFGECLSDHKKRVLLHAVSVGEINAIRNLVRELLDQKYDVVISVTTDTGLARAKDLYSSECVVTRYPLDFSFSVRNFIQRIKPTVVALVELEVWPNFVSRCAKENIPVLIINGRLSERSFNRYRFAKIFLKSTFKRLTAIGMQTEKYANRVRSIGANAVAVQGSMKWDNATLNVSSDDSRELAEDLGISSNIPLIVMGSSAPEEHELILDCLPENVQLLCAPRRPEWFDLAAKTLDPCNRRTHKKRVDTRYFLLDTIGELEAAYELADIVIIGRSFAPLHGSDPTSSIALGKPTIIGPNVSDFEEMVQVLVSGGGLVQCTKYELPSILSELIFDSAKRDQMSRNGIATINKQQGATERYKQLIIKHTPNA